MQLQSFEISGLQGDILVKTESPRYALYEVLLRDGRAFDMERVNGVFLAVNESFNSLAEKVGMVLGRC